MDHQHRLVHWLLAKRALRNRTRRAMDPCMLPPHHGWTNARRHTLAASRCSNTYHGSDSCRSDMWEPRSGADVVAPGERPLVPTGGWTVGRVQTRNVLAQLLNTEDRTFLSAMVQGTYVFRIVYQRQIVPLLMQDNIPPSPIEIEVTTTRIWRFSCFRS